MLNGARCLVVRGVSKRKYPRCGETRRHERNKTQHCKVEGCEGIAKTRQFIEFSWFRGDDEPVWVCAARNHTEEEMIDAYFAEAKRKTEDT